MTHPHKLEALASAFHYATSPSILKPLQFPKYYPNSYSPDSSSHNSQKMAFSLRLPVASFLPKTSVRSKAPPVSRGISLHDLKLKTVACFRKKQSVAVKAIEESQESTEKSETADEPEFETSSRDGQSSAELSELGSEIKKVLQERKEEKEGDLWNGVVEEIREIEWPPFGKVLGTTGVVLGVIAGSSVVLLTVNFVLAELSDRVFAGRGVQDFFG